MLPYPVFTLRRTGGNKYSLTKIHCAFCTSNILAKKFRGSEMVVPKINLFENRFGILSSQGFQIYKYHFCCQYFVCADTGGHCALFFRAFKRGSSHFCSYCTSQDISILLNLASLQNLEYLYMYVGKAF